MRIIGRSFSNWWLLLILPILALSVPVLIFILFASQEISGVIFGPPAIWSRPWHTPPKQDLVGKYVESERSWNKTGKFAKAQLELKADGTMTVSDLPLTFGEDTACMLTGTGRWQGPDNERRINLTFDPASEKADVCRSTYISGFELAGHAKPFSLYWTLGDPDSGMGVWLTRN